MKSDLPEAFRGALGQRFEFEALPRQGRHGGRLPRPGPLPRARRGAEGRARGAGVGRGPPAARAPLVERDAARRPPQAPLHPRDLRGRHRGRPQLPRDGVPVGRHAVVVHDAGDAAAPVARGRHRVQGEPRPRVRQHAGPAASRREARQRAARGGRHAQDQRLRRGVPRGRGAHAGDRRGHARLHAGRAFRGGGAERAARHLRDRRHGLQPAHRRLSPQVGDAGRRSSTRSSTASPSRWRAAGRACPPRWSPPSRRRSIATGRFASRAGRRSATRSRRRSRSSSRSRPRSPRARASRSCATSPSSRASTETAGVGGRAHRRGARISRAARR